ncbi:site-specific integrase [Vibrio cholerae]|nr:site-specific integrase [Vibrio cholerae]EGR2446345.1 site-specific integrase [Vibrio cholerae]EGR4136951.1 site-specific integrase [Vibrio cholerae]
MAKFAKNVDPKAVAEKQAANVMKQMQGKILSSVGTVRNYEERLSIVAQYANAEFKCGLRDLTVKQAHQYLTDRAAEVGQKTLDMERQAIQSMMQNVTRKLGKTEKLDVIKSEHQQILSSRSYTNEQVQMVVNAQTERNALATEIAHAAGLRAHELHTLLRIEERNPDPRPALKEKFSGRNGERYTVEGKGGLVREVLIPQSLAERLEERRLNQPMQITDRGVNYTSYYDINGGNRWSSSFSAASNRALTWSAGAHGLRHSYAQERMNELQKSMAYEKALEVVSQEMGHFRRDITEVYLR